MVAELPLKFQGSSQGSSRTGDDVDDAIINAMAAERTSTQSGPECWSGELDGWVSWKFSMMSWIGGIAL